MATVYAPQLYNIAEIDRHIWYVHTIILVTYEGQSINWLHV